MLGQRCSRGVEHRRQRPTAVAAGRTGEGVDGMAPETIQSSAGVIGGQWRSAGD
jgi:hypothetical protein